MAVYVKMIKKFDDEKRVVYQFGPNEKQMGEIEFDKEKKIFKCHASFTPFWYFSIAFIRTSSKLNTISILFLSYT